jgi:hypothetical protein
VVAEERLESHPMNLRSKKADAVAMWVVRIIWLVCGTFGAFAWEMNRIGLALAFSAGCMLCLPLVAVVGLVFMPPEKKFTSSGAEIVSDSKPR